MEETKNTRLSACQNDMANILRGASITTGTDTATATAYLLAQAAKYNYPFGVELQLAVDDAMRTGIKLHGISDLLDERVWNDLKELCKEYSYEDFMNVAALPALNTDRLDEWETPACLRDLAVRLLNATANEKVADFCCGHGGVAIELAKDGLLEPVQGIEVKEQAAITAKIRALAAGANVTISVGDVFDVPNANLKFDKIFCNYPFGLQLRELGPKHEYLQTIAKEISSISKATSSDWLFNHLLIDSLNVGGKAIAIMTNGSTWNTIDKNIRAYFVEQGYIECLIALPAKLFASTNIPTTMIVLSHGNQSVRMVDATEVCQKGRRQNVFSAEDIERIVRACNEDSEIGKILSVEELRENEFVLHPDRYVAKTVNEGVPFDTVIKSINRGAHCTAEQLDEMSTQDETNIHFLRTSDIQDGMIVSPLQSLSYIRENFEKYCINNNSLVISKVGFPYKVAVASVADGDKLLANANLYVVELDMEKVDPYYLKAFFESEEGQSRFRSITVGATIPSIGVKDLKSINIPLPSMEEQRKIGQRCKDVLDEIARLKERLEQAKKRLTCLTNE